LTRTERDISNSDWVTHNLAEEGADTRNQVTVNYDNGNKAIQVDNAADQLDIQRNLGAAGPGVQGKTITRPKITNVNDAIAAGERFLKGRDATLTGSVTATDLHDAAPGQVVNIQIDARGIDRDFRIAENRSNWLRETNELVVVDKKGADDDVLVEQSQTLDRVSNRDADPSVQPDITTDTKPASSVEVTAEVTGEPAEVTVAAGDTLTVTDTDTQTFEFATVHGTLSVEQTGQAGTDDILTVSPSITTNADVARFVNDGRNRLRDAILAGTTLTGFDIAFSASDDRPIRSDDSVSGPRRAAQVQVLANAATSFEADLQDAVETRTVGLIESATDNLIALARLEEPLSFVNTAQLAISFAPDDETTTTFTQQGLEFLSKVIAGVDASPPAIYAYGSDDSLPSTNDTTLGNEVISSNFDENVVQEADSDAEWNSILNLSTDSPVFVSDGKLQNHQSLTYTDSDEFGTFNVREITNNPDFTNGTAVGLSTDIDNFSFSFTTPYDIPAGALDIEWHGRAEADSIRIEWTIDGNVIGDNEFSIAKSDTLWRRAEQDGNPSLSAGSHTLICDGVFRFNDPGADEGGFIDIGAVAVYDNRFDYNFDNQPDANLLIDGPELYPDLTVTTTTESNVLPTTFTRGRLRSVWNDTSNDQFIGISGDGSNFITQSNTQVITEDLGEVNSAFGRFGVSRYSPDGPRNVSPRFGYESQTVDSSILAAIGDNLRAEDIGTLRLQTLIQQGDAVGKTFAEAGLKAADGTLLTRSLVPEFEKQQGQSVFSSEILSWQNEDSA
jgi:hypothetical protein